MVQHELAAVTSQQAVDFLAEDKIVINTARPAIACLDALARIYENKLWRAPSAAGERFATFDAYCKKRFDRSGSYMSRQIGYEKFKERQETLPMGKIIDNERKHRALVGFRSELQDEILTQLKNASDNGETITVGTIERIGRAVQDTRTPQVESPLPTVLNEYKDDAEEDAAPAISNEEVLEAVAKRTGTVAVHPLIRCDEEVRLAEKKVKKTVPADMEDENLKNVAQRLRGRLKSFLGFLDKLLLAIVDE